MKDKKALLDSVPGLGERTIAILLPFFGDPGRFGKPPHSPGSTPGGTSRAAA
jgi:hypothetical protein